MLLLLSFKKSLSVGLILILVFLSGTFYWQNAVTSAQEADQQINAILSICSTSFNLQASEALADFYDKLSEVSANNQVVSEQINVMYDEFRSFKQQLNEFYTDVVDQVDVNFSIDSNRQAIARCDRIKDLNISIAKNVLQKFLTQAAANKRDLAIVQQYDELLKDSDRLLRELGALKTNFQDFSNRVPCIALSCVQN